MVLALAVSLLVLGLKFLAYWLTNSAAIFSDALESVVNVAAASFSLYAVRYGAQAPDEEHPYGHGKMEFVASGFEGGLILMAGVGMLFQAYRAASEATDPLASLDLGLALTLLTLALNFSLGWWLQNRGRVLRSPILQADGRHLLVDSWSSVGLLLGLVVVYWTGLRWVDALLAALLGAWVIWQGFWLVRASLGGLLDETDTALLVRIAQLLEQRKAATWIDVHNLRVVRHGADIHIDCHLTLPCYWQLHQVHNELKRIEELLRTELAAGARLEIFIHPDPCIFEACPTCSVPDCPIRQAPLRERPTWTVDRIRRDRKHALEPGLQARLQPPPPSDPA